MTEEPIPVAVYMRVSSDDQRDRETIKTQREAIDRFLAQNPQYVVYRYYEDDGVSGTIPMALRPAGAQMVADAKAGKFFKVVVLRASRLGREEIDLLTTYNLFVDLLGIEIIGVAEPLGDRTMFGFQSIMAGYARRQFLADSARGMERAAKEGRYTGGIVPLGYRVDGRRQTARLIPDETIIWGDWTAADLVRRIYHWLGVEGKSCRWIAHELNLLRRPHLVPPRRSRRTRQEHAGTMAPRPNPQLGREPRVQGHTPLRPAPQSQLQEDGPDPRLRAAARVRRALGGRTADPGRQPHLRQEHSEGLPSPLRDNLRGLRPALRRHPWQGRHLLVPLQRPTRRAGQDRGEGVRASPSARTGWNPSCGETSSVGSATPATSSMRSTSTRNRKTSGQSSRPSGSLSRRR